MVKERERENSALLGWLCAAAMGFVCDWQRSITLQGEANEAGASLLRGLAEKRLLQGLGLVVSGGGYSAPLMVRGEP